MTVSYVAQCSVLLPLAHHLKLNDLSSISCLLSMRLCRHANNRKFALTGIDQQPFIVTHDSEVSHDSGACKTSLYFIISHSRNTKLSLGLLFHMVSHSARAEINWRWKLQRLWSLWLYKGRESNYLPSESCVCVWSTRVCVCVHIVSGKSHISRVTQCWWATNIWLCRTSLLLQDTHIDPFPFEGCSTRRQGVASLSSSWKTKQIFTPVTVMESRL